MPNAEAGEGQDGMYKDRLIEELGKAGPKLCGSFGILMKLRKSSRSQMSQGTVTLPRTGLGNGLPVPLNNHTNEI